MIMINERIKQNNWVYFIRFDTKIIIYKVGREKKKLYEICLFIFIFSNVLQVPVDLDYHGVDPKAKIKVLIDLHL
jgi:hypothetical protein